MGQGLSNYMAEDLKIRKFTDQILQSQLAFPQEQGIGILRVKIFTAFLTINSVILGAVSIFKLGLCKNSLLTVATLLYLNIAWNLYASKRVFEGKLRQSDNVIGYWYREYYSNQIKRLTNTRRNKQFESVYIDPVSGKDLI